MVTDQDYAALREALREALDHIRAYEDALGHSYCDLNVGGGWASDDCTCGFAEKFERWNALLAAPAPGEPGLDEAVEVIYRALTEWDEAERHARDLRAITKADVRRLDRAADGSRIHAPRRGALARYIAARLRGGQE